MNSQQVEYLIKTKQTLPPRKHSNRVKRLKVAKWNIFPFQKKCEIVESEFSGSDLLTK